MNCLANVRCFTFVGETGSGKTELAVNWAMELARTQKKRVCFFDMDQTKGLFRARDLEAELSAAGVTLFDTVQFQDSPIVPGGVTGALEDEDSLCVFDVGGNAIGARMIGQFSRYLTQGCHFYVINPNRPFSREPQEIQASMEWILNAGRIPETSIKIISNPCLGEQTTVKTVLQDHQKLVESLAIIGREPALLAVNTTLAPEVKAAVGCFVYPVQLYVKNLYMT